MATALDLSPTLWRKRLREASFRGVPFHTDGQARTSGRRTVLHQYPKRDDPYAEDLGREARRYQITGYVIQKFHVRQNSAFSINYDIARDRLVEALEKLGTGILVDPYNNRVGPQLFQCERYSMSETRERGGYAQFEMVFVEAGIPAMGQFVGTDSVSQVRDTSAAATAAAGNQLNQQQAIANDPNAPASFADRFFFPTQ